jgi:predicted enzyme related to lactoylglutathione lyase
MPRVCHFEIHADDPARAATFYTTLFGWKITKWAGPMEYHMVDTGEGVGINGGIVRRMGPRPVEGQAVNSYVCTVDVPSVDTYFANALAAGATVAVPKMPIPGVGWLAYVKDPEGNILGMMQNDPTVPMPTT